MMSAEVIMVLGFVISCILGYIMINYLIDIIQPSSDKEERETYDGYGAEKTEYTDMYFGFPKQRKGYPYSSPFISEYRG